MTARSAVLAVLLSGSVLSANQAAAPIRIAKPGAEWVLSAAGATRRLALTNGSLRVMSITNKSGRELGPQGGADALRLAAGSGAWTFESESVRRLSQGEHQLDLTLRRGPVRVVKHYVVYPDSTVVREWLTIANASQQPLRISEPSFLETRAFAGSGLEFLYMTGGGNYLGSQILRTDKADTSWKRVLDSYGGIDPYKMGVYNAWLPLAAIHDPANREGMMIGWDYLGHWVLSAARDNGSPIDISLVVAGYDKQLQPGESIETPKAFTGLFSGDIDDMGNAILDWQYQYMWEYTNPTYFARTRWSIDWPMPWAPAGGKPSADNWGRRFMLDLRYIDLMREAGGEILWDDAGWYDKWGSWRGPDWRQTTDYLKKSGMAWKLWIPTFLAAPDSKVAQQHPDWLIRGENNLDQAIPATADWQLDLMNKLVKQWGDFQYRYDGGPATTTDDTSFLASDQNFRSFLERFRKANPGSGIDSCHGGGRWISYDLARLSDSGEYVDGGVGPYTGYYTTLLIPPDKLHNNADFDHTVYKKASDRTHLTIAPMWYRDPGDGENVEAIRRDWDLYRYMLREGVAGRWSHVFRPRVENDEAVWYSQRMNRDGSKGVLVTRHARPSQSYLVIAEPLDVKPAEHQLGTYAPLPLRTGGDSYLGYPWYMNEVATTPAARIDAAIYEDPYDGTARAYGAPGEAFGPMNFRYRGRDGSETSFVTSIPKQGMRRFMSDKFFGMSVQPAQPLEITEIGQFDPLGRNTGRYRLKIVRESDRTVLGETTLDTGRTHVDALGFKYAKLDKPVRLEPAAPPVRIYPKGLQPALTYDVHCAESNCSAKRTGADLMQNGIVFRSVEAGELVFFNMAGRPGSGTDKTAPGAPSNITQRVASNIGFQGVEIAWQPARDNNWISYYEVLRDGVVVSKVATGTYFFDYRDGAARRHANARYEVRTVDGDGNRSPAVAAGVVAGEPETIHAFGSFASLQDVDGWRYEEAAADGTIRPMSWDPGGYEGRWTGSGPARIGRMWMQPGAETDVMRTWIASRDGVISIHSQLRKDPSAENGRAIAARILHNEKQIWPNSGWAAVEPVYERTIDMAVHGLAVRKGDTVRFVVKRTGSTEPDPILWSPKIIMGTTR